MLIILRLVFLAVVDYLSKLPKPPKPDYCWGKLPQIAFPNNASPSGQLTYTLQTADGELPEASTAARVYFMPKNIINLLSLSNAQSFVQQLGFTATPKQAANQTMYHWIDPNAPLRTIDMDIVNKTFTLKYAYTQELSIFQGSSMQSPVDTIETAYEYFESLQLLQPDLSPRFAKQTYLKLVGDKLESATSQSQAQAARVDFYRMPYNGIRTVSDHPEQGLVNITFNSSSDLDKKFVAVNYTYWPIETPRKPCYYPLKKPQDAWNELKSGNAYFASFPHNQTNYVITNVYLAYYDSTTPQYYFRPVYVFEGEQGFFAYVPALTE